MIPSIVSPELNAETVRGRRGLYGQDGCKKGAAKYPEMISNIATSAWLFRVVSPWEGCVNGRVGGELGVVWGGWVEEGRVIDAPDVPGFGST